MNAERRTALTAGVLFVVATAASLIGTALEQPVLQGKDYLGRVVDGATRISAGALLELVAAGTSVGIAIALYPALRKWSAGLALGSVVFRAIEAVMYTVGAVGLLSVLAAGPVFARSGAPDRAAIQAMGDLLLGLRQEAILAGVFGFSVGALMYYLVFYRAGLVPRWLSGWGIVAVILMLLACLSALFSGSAVQTYTYLILPIAVQELVLAAWLITKGFSTPAFARGSATDALSTT